DAGFGNGFAADRAYGWRLSAGFRAKCAHCRRGDDLAAGEHHLGFRDGGHAMSGEIGVEKWLMMRNGEAAPLAEIPRVRPEQYGVHPIGHPWLKPLRYHDTDNGSPAPWGTFDASLPIPGDYPFYRVEGEEVHEVAVGPVHAGIIEPGHFRFQCHGEEVLHLEISLGYQHRGVERALVGGPNKRTIHYMETLAGDTSVGHATAYCQA